MKVPSLVVHMRHPESVAGRLKKKNIPSFDVGYFSDKDVPLTVQGYAQAIKTGEALRDRFGMFDRMYYSTYRRSKQTMVAVRQAYPLELREEDLADGPYIQCIEHPLLDERNEGKLYGKNESQKWSLFPIVAALAELFGEIEIPFPDGDNFLHVFDNIDRFAEKELSRCAGEKIFISGHFGSNFGFLRRYGGANGERLSNQEVLRLMAAEPPYGSITVYEAAHKGRTLVLKEKDVVLLEERELLASEA